MLPGGARGVSPPGCPPPSSATYIRPPAAPRPQLTTPELRPEPRAAGKRGGSGGFLGAVVIPSLEPLTEKTRLSRWSLPQARWSGSNKKKKGEKGRGEHSGGPERAASPYLPPPAVSGSSGPSPPTPPLPRLPPPLSPPTGTCRTLAGLFREGVQAVGSSMEAGTFFDPVEEEDLLCSKSE